MLCTLWKFAFSLFFFFTTLSYLTVIYREGNLIASEAYGFLQVLVTFRPEVVILICFSIPRRRFLHSVCACCGGCLKAGGFVVI